MSNPSGPNAPQPDPEPRAWPLYEPQQPKKKPTGLIILVVGLVGLLLVGSFVAVLASQSESSGPTVQESQRSGPTVQEWQPDASASDEPTTDNSTEEPTKEPTKEPSPYRQGKLAKAAEQKFTSADGLVIRITNFKRGTVGRNAEGGHPGDPMVLFTVHIKNGTSHKVDADEFSVEVTYGDDDDDAEAIHGNGLDDVTGVIAKGRSKTGQYGFAVPIRDMDELLIDVSDYDHDPFFWPVK
jgi:hypothetical protein